MKHFYFLLFILFSFQIGNSQNASVEKNVYGIQTGFLGFWAHNETKLGNQFALRSEVGFDAGFVIETYSDQSGFLLTPVVTLEPRWYYNLNSRVEKSKRIDGNSGNFVSIKTSYHPDWFNITNFDNVFVYRDIQIIPTWGIRRNLGAHFNYETGIGIGYRYVIDEPRGVFGNDDGNLAVNLHLRIGYRF